MKNGFIIEIVEWIIKIFNKINIVEHFKNIANLITKNKEKRIAYKNILIDIFILLKFLFLIIVIWLNANSIIIAIIVWYLIIFNLHTYFYRHLWIPPYNIETKNIHRRFISLVTSFVFSNISFYYLYFIFYSCHFQITEGKSAKISFLLYSFYNSIFGSYVFVKPIDNYGAFVSLFQLSITFIFISIILTNSIPQFKKD